MTHNLDRISEGKAIPQQALEEPEGSLVLENLHILASRPDQSSVGDGPSGRVCGLLRDDDGHVGLVAEERCLREGTRRDGLGEDGGEDLVLLLLLNRSDLSILASVHRTSARTGRLTISGAGAAAVTVGNASARSPVVGRFDPLPSRRSLPMSVPPGAGDPTRTSGLLDPTEGDRARSGVELTDGGREK